MKARQILEIDVQIDDDTIFRETRERLLRAYGMTPNQWVGSDGQICEDEDHYHGSVGTRRLGPATPEQRSMWEALVRFNNAVNGRPR